MPLYFQIIRLLFVVLVFGQVSMAFASKRPTFQNIKSREPHLTQILKRYYQREGISMDYIEGWLKRAKRAPYLPTLYVGYDHALKEAQGVSVNDNISISGGVTTIGPYENDYDYDENLGQTVRVRAVWKLDEVVFNRNYIALSKEKRDLAKLRFEIGHRISVIYEKRQLLMMRYLQLAKAQNSKTSLIYTQYELLTDQLDALTGGVFHQRWWRRGAK